MTLGEGTALVWVTRAQAWGLIPACGLGLLAPNCCLWGCPTLSKLAQNWRCASGELVWALSSHTPHSWP